MPLTLTVAFYRGPAAFGDKLIRLWTRSRYSHCEVVFAGSGLRADQQDGVVWRLWTRSSHWDTVEVPVLPDPYLRALAQAQAELGCAYDWQGIWLSQVLGLRREDPKRWFCSELCAALLQTAEVLDTGRRACTYSPGALRDTLLVLPGVKA